MILDFRRSRHKLFFPALLFCLFAISCSKKQNTTDLHSLQDSLNGSDLSQMTLYTVLPSNSQVQINTSGVIIQRSETGEVKVYTTGESIVICNLGNGNYSVEHQDHQCENPYHESNEEGASNSGGSSSGGNSTPNESGSPSGGSETLVCKSLRLSVKTGSRMRVKICNQDPDKFQVFPNTEATIITNIEGEPTCGFAVDLQPINAVNPIYLLKWGCANGEGSIQME